MMPIVKTVEATVPSYQAAAETLGPDPAKLS